MARSAGDVHISNTPSPSMTCHWAAPPCQPCDRSGLGGPQPLTFEAAVRIFR